MTTIANELLRIGDLLDGKYRLVRLLGQGGMSAVYEARHSQIERRVAIKFLLPEIATDPQLIVRFRNEARAAGALHHENIAAVYDVGTTANGAQYLVMEWLDGMDCAQLLQTSGTLSRTRAVDLVIQVCRGLAEAHNQQIVHRDLKPANLFLTRRGDGADLIKVLDFGIAKLRRTPEADLSTFAGAALGTPYYMSPEQARADRDIDARSDVYSLGVILFELLSGRTPHEGASVLQVLHRILTQDAPRLSQLRHDLPAGLCDVVARALARAREERYASMLELQRALQPFASPDHARGAARDQTAPGTLQPFAAPDHARTVAQDQTAPGTESPSAPSRRRLALWLAVCGLLGAGALLGMRYFRQDAQPNSPKPTQAAEAAPVRYQVSERPVRQAVQPSSLTPTQAAEAAPVRYQVSERPLDRPDAAREALVPSAAPQPPASAPVPRSPKAAERKPKQIEQVAPPPSAPEVVAPPTPVTPPSAAPERGRRLSVDPANPYP